MRRSIRVVLMLAVTAVLVTLWAVGAGLMVLGCGVTNPYRFPRLARAFGPISLLALAGLLALEVGLYRYLSRPAPRPGLCRSCGYDLEGNESGTCPECGTRISQR